MNAKKILFIEPFYGGSHKNFTDGLIKHSRHSFILYSLPARYWKWRMRGAALHFYETIRNPENYDLLFTSDMMSLSDLKMLWGPSCPPSIVYFHENQLSYPLPEGGKMDYQFGFTDITTALAADRLLFNSNFHLNSFLKNMPGFIRKMPEYKPLWVVDKIRKKSSVIYPGCDFPAEGFRSSSKDSSAGRTPVVLWNHRWEFDKCPEVFFEALEQVDLRFKRSGIENPFDLVLLGENFQMMPKAFIEAKDRWGGRILQYGYCKNRDEYISWLKKSDIVISTAIQENFGIAVVEAIAAGCVPLLPGRLSYPELVPDKYHSRVLYNSEEDLAEKLESALKQLHQYRKNKSAAALSEYFKKFSWRNVIDEFDLFLTESALN